jgi:hypothetical protein
LKGALQFVQELPGAPHQALSAGRRLVGVGREAVRQLQQSRTAPCIQTGGWSSEFASQIGAELLAPALEITEAAIGFQLQRLLQRTHPRLNR